MNLDNKKWLRIALLIVMDIIAICSAYLLALYAGFEAVMPLEYYHLLQKWVWLIVIIKILVYYLGRLYRTLWIYAGIDEMLQILVTTVLANVATISCLYSLHIIFPRRVHLIVFIVDVMFIGGIRISYRVLRRWKHGTVNGDGKRIMIIGAGDAGVMVMRELRNHTNLNSKTVALIDDSPQKQGLVINGVKVMGGRNEIISVAEEMKINEIIIAMPSAKKSEISSIVDICKHTRCKLRILPGLYQIINGKIDIKQIRDVQVEDLLGREEVCINIDEVSSYLNNKNVLVTGGGGSIGSELCRQIARFNPANLLILDIYENNAYDIENQLKQKYPELKLKVLIASVRDRDRLEQIFADYKPHVVFHAAAHKHVPLMEVNPKEAIKNNILGTLNVAQMAAKYEVERFVMISTDKAVNPTNVMGASKRFCEMIVQSLNPVTTTEFVAVRFGNVLGSNGSVIPLFKRQIAAGGPVTVTHPDVIRYFMTIPEASQLVIQAGAMARGGEVFVLNMGKPVRIMDLACDLIRLSGFEPGVDIPITIVGLRPGEKLYEELLMEEEGIKDTEHQRIFIGNPLQVDYETILTYVERFKELIKNGSEEETVAYLQQVVPTFCRKSEQEQLAELEVAASN